MTTPALLDDRVSSLIFDDWLALLTRHDMLPPAEPPPWWAAVHGGSSRSEVTAAARDLVRALCRGSRTVDDPPIETLGPMPVSPEIAFALLAVLVQWKVPSSVLLAADAAFAGAS